MLDTVSFSWTAPAPGTGKVRFYAVMNAVDFNGAGTGDQQNTATAEINEAPLGVPSFMSGKLSIYPNPLTDLNDLRISGLAPEYDADIIIADAAGKAIVRHTAPANAQGEALINVHRLGAGRYYAVILQRGMLRFAPFAKQ